MMSQMQEFVAERTSALTHQVKKMRKESVENVREVIADSAQNLKSLKSPVRVVARSGIRLTVVSQTAMSSLIDLQSDMVTSALSAAALRLEKAARAENVFELVRDQIDMLPATRDRMIEDAQRAVEIFKVAGRDLKNVAVHAYERVLETAEEKVPEVKTAKRKVKTATRKAKTRVRKVAAAAEGAGG